MTRQRASTLLIALTALRCGTTTPRFGQDVQSAVVQSSMRRLETQFLVVYYPEPAREEAYRVASRVEACGVALREHTRIWGAFSRQKPRVVLAPLPYNNAYVALPQQADPIAVVPTWNTTELFTYLNLTPDPGAIGCHEVVHYIHALQVGGFHRDMMTLFGPAYSPQSGLDSWFFEGLAVYYETKLQAGLGRLGTRYFEGILAAGTAESGLDSGMPHAFHRTPLYGGNYLLGAAFIDWLARSNGEGALFEVIRQQGRDVFFPFGVESRFKAAYGRSLTALFDEFAADLARQYPRTERPAEQQTLTDAGVDARYALGRSGHEALVTLDWDTPVRLLIRDPRGRTLVDRNLTDVLPGRILLRPSTASVSGLSFTRDGSRLYFVLVDTGSLYSRARLVAVDTATGVPEIAVDDLGGAGGSLSPDGNTYYFAGAAGDAYGLSAVDLPTRRVRWIRAPEAQRFHSGVRVSPDGSRLLVTRTDRTGFWLAVVDVRSGAILDELTTHSGPAISADWIDDDHIIFTAEHQGRMQVHTTELSTHLTRVVTCAPYLAFAPQSNGTRLRFLNRVGWRWSLDEVLLANDLTDPRPHIPSSHAVTTRDPVRDRPIRVQGDEPYSATEQLLLPQVRGVWLESASSQSTRIGAGVNGGDPLGYHRWALRGAYEVESQLPSGEITYYNSQLAPLRVTLRGAVDQTQQLSAGAPSELGAEPLTETREASGVLSVGRSFYGATFVATGLRYDGISRNLTRTGAPFETGSFGGYFASLAYFAAETTPYTGARRAFWFSAQGTLFPKLFQDQRFSLMDLGAEIGGTLPLLLRRLSVDVSVRGRYVPGAPVGAELLQIGGASALQPPGSSAATARPGEVFVSGSLPPRLRFFEPLAGFENLARFDRGVALGEIALRYPLIVDWGSLSSLYIFPSFLLRQLDWVAFVNAARFLDARRDAAAAGGRLILRMALASTPLSLGLQVARRLSDDEKFSTYLSLQLE